MGLNSLPVTLGPDRAAKVACWCMSIPQVAVIALMFSWGKPLHAGAITVLLLAQLAAMRVLLGDPKGKAPWYQGTGITLYVTGMMIAAYALRNML